MRTASKLTGDVYDENQVLCLQYIFCFCLFCEMALDGNSTRIVSVYRSASGMIWYRYGMDGGCVIRGRVVVIV